ncbi:SWIRM domain-containing protein [Poronia punctata]|nr:SWIRM domain-containing protein [Poronia punctata]
MASSSMPVDNKKPCDIHNLMSPPEPPKFESFNMPKSISAASGISRWVQTTPATPLSPPISPAIKTDDHIMNDDASTSAPVKDPILFPVLDSANTPPQQPLFGQEDSADTRRIVDGHVLARPVELFKDAAPPMQDDYELVLFFKSEVMKLYKQDPRLWLKRERALLIADRRAQARNRQFRLQPILPAKAQVVRKEAQRVKPAKTPKVTKQPPVKPRPIRAGPSPSTALVKPIARALSSTPDPSPRRGAAPNRVDTDFESLPDYCPPLSSLPNKPNSLKIDWKGTAMDLGDDPYRHLLHEDELLLASNLRLSCATYLTSKRRMFIRRLECLRNRKDFRKTDAQQTCKIDVNKASKLWTAFHSVGWLHPSWVEPYL